MAVYDVVLDTSSSPMILTFMFDIGLEYHFLNHGATFTSYAIQPQIGFLTMPEGITLCGCGLNPTYQVAYSCNPDSITTTSTMVQGYVNLDFTVSNLCAPTICCLDLPDPL